MNGLRAAAFLLVTVLAGACTASPSPTATPPGAPPTGLVPALAPSTLPGSPTQSLAVLTPTTSPTAPPSPTPTGATLAPSPTFGPTEAPTPESSPAESVAPSPSVPASSNLVEVAAGGGSADPSAGGTATDAHIEHPTGLAVAGNGIIGIVDSNAGTVLAVGPDGLIATAAAGMTGPQGMCLTFEGVAYVAERGANRVIKITSNGGLLAVAGSEFHADFRGDGGPAKKAYLSQPYDVACDAAGNLYIADTTNARVRFIDAQTGTITTVAGNGTQGFAGDGGPALDAELTNPQAVAVDPAGTVLYIADYGDSHLRRVDLATGIITTVLGSGTGPVSYDPSLTALQVAPTRLIAVALDAQGNVYVPVFFTDKGQMVMRVDPTGHLSIVAGGGTSSDIGVTPTDFRLPSIEALAIEPTTGALLIASNDGRVYRIPGVATPTT